MQNDLFEKWYIENHPHSSLEKCEKGSYFRKKAALSLQSFQAGQQSQKAKIDELQKQLALVLDAYYLTDYFDANVCISAENALGDENRLSDSWYLKNVKGEPNDQPRN